MRLIAHFSLYDKQIDIDYAKEILKDIIPSEESKLITLDIVQQHIIKHYKISDTQLKSKKRGRSLVFPRQIAMYLCRELTECSFPEIGEKFGGKDHTTIMYACRKIKERREKDKNFNKEIEEIIQKIIS